MYNISFIVICFITTLILPKSLQAQCLNKVSHFNGTETVNCVDVTVTPAGTVLNANSCIMGPYRIGQFVGGSLTFDFSETITGVTIDVTSINTNFPIGASEELAVFINGAFYPITQPGVSANCLNQQDAEISGTGTIVACDGCLGSWKDITIIEPINTITIEARFISGFPGGMIFSLYICCCETDAGEITSNPLSLCPDDIATVPDAQQTNLEADDLLQYILFSDLNDTLGSIISTSNTPSFLFTPATMQLGTSYYIAAIAGNNVGGNVDLTETCLDISNAIEVIWNPYPSVTFSVSDPDVCAGNCTDVTATFIGTPPFSLSYIISGNPPTNVSFTGNTGIFQVCVDVDTPAGNLVLQATSLVDAYCTCN